MESSRHFISRLLISLFLYTSCVLAAVPSADKITKIYGIIFDPPYATIGERLCMTVNYTIEEGHYLQRIQLEVNAETSIGIYSFTAQDASDPGEPYYYDNDWGNRAGRARIDLDKTFCFRSIKERDMDLTFIWRLYSHSVNPLGNKAIFHYSFNLPKPNSLNADTGPSPQGLTKINNMIFEPSYAVVGETLCMLLNYTIEPGHYLHVLRLEAVDKGNEEDGTVVYSFTRQDVDDLGVPVYHNNDWGNRVVKSFRKVDSPNILCLRTIKESDLKQTFVWRLFSENIKHKQIKSRFHYFFTIPDSTSSNKDNKEELIFTKIYGIRFEPSFPKSGEPLCMTVNYTIENGHFMDKLQLESETDGGSIIYSITKKNINEEGLQFYNHNNDWGRRAERRRSDLKNTFCFRYIKTSDFNEKFVWILHSQNIINKGITSRFHYFFQIPDSNSITGGVGSGSAGSLQGTTTKMYGINFNPTTIRFGQPLCMTLNYTIEEGHFLNKLELEVNADGGTQIYSFTKQNFADPGNAFYNHNEWGNRVDKSNKDVDKIFCFTYIKRNDMAYTFVWRLYSQSLIHSHVSSRFSYSFRMPASPSQSFTKIYGITFDPAYPKVGNALCLTLNYSIQDGHFLHKLQLHVADEDNLEIYSFIKQNLIDEGEVEYHDNDWGRRIERTQKDKDKRICFRNIKKHDLSQTFVWSIQSQNIIQPSIKRRFRYIFNYPEQDIKPTDGGGLVSGPRPTVGGFEHGTSTKIYGIKFNPSSSKFDEPLCMILNFTIQNGHFLNKVELEVNDDGTQIYSLTRQNNEDPGNAVYNGNDWSRRINKSTAGPGNICFTSLKRSDLRYSYVWRILSQDINNPSIRNRFSYSFRLPELQSSSATKVNGVSFEPEKVRLGLPLCVTLNYTIQEDHFLQKIQLTVDGDNEVYTFTRLNEDDLGEKMFYDTEWGNRINRLSIPENRVCFKNIKQTDLDPTYVWTIKSQHLIHPGITRRFHYIFNIPDYKTSQEPPKLDVDFHSALTKIYGVQFDPLQGQPGRQLCMILNYTIQEGHFLQKLQLEVDSDENPIIYFYVKQTADDPGIVEYMENDWGDRAERTGKNKDKTFCFKTLKSSDMKHSYIWTIQSQDSLNHRIKRRFEYVFTLPEKQDEKEGPSSTTQIHGVKFEPRFTIAGEPLCMTLNYSIYDGHFLTRLGLEVDANGNREIFSLTRPRPTDPGVAIYQDNDWGNRAERRSHDRDKMFCFKFAKTTDIAYDFVFRIQSKNINNLAERKTAQYTFNLPETSIVKPQGSTDDSLDSTGTRISGITFDPPYATTGNPLCMILNYTLEKGHFLLATDLEVEDEDEIYSFVRQSANDPGVVIYSDNDWGDRAERLRNNREKVFCFDNIKRSDMGQKFTWSIESRNQKHPNVKRKFHYTFALPDYDSFQTEYNKLPESSKPSMTDIKSVTFNTPYAQTGEPLCMTINYSLQSGHFLQSMDLDVDANGGTEVYSYSKYSADDEGDVIQPANDWGNRVKLTRKDRDKTICFEKIRKGDFDHLFTSTLVSQSLISPMIRRSAQYSFSLPESENVDTATEAVARRPLFTKIYGVKFNPSNVRVGRPLCMTVNYTIQDENFLHRLILEVISADEDKLYSFIKLYPDDSGRVIYYDNPWSIRADKNRQDLGQTFCFTEIKENDLKQTFIWRLQSQNIYHKDLQRTSHYSFNLQDENIATPPVIKEVIPLETKINGVNFIPSVPQIGEPLSIILNYTLEDSHFLHNARLEVDDDEQSTPIYSLTKYAFNDPGRIYYYANDWSARADRRNEDLEKPSFTFKYFKRSDLDYVFFWKIISQSIFNKGVTTEKTLSFKIPDNNGYGKLDVSPVFGALNDGEYTPNSTIISIHNAVLNPPFVNPGEPLCLTLNYSIMDGYYLRQLLLQTDSAEQSSIYSYTKEHRNDPGTPFYYDNSWGNRADRLNEDLNRTFCYKIADEDDIDVPYLFKVYAHDNLNQGAKVQQSHQFTTPGFLPHDHYGGFDDRNHVTIELIVGLLVGIVVLLAFLGLFLYFCCCGGCLDKNCTCTPEKSCGKDSEACLAQQRLLYD